MKLSKKEGLLIGIGLLLLIAFLLFWEGPIIPQKSQPLFVEITNPYEDSVIIANSNTPENTSYEWYLEGSLIRSGKTDTIFLTHFDGNLLGEGGESPTGESFISFENGKFNQGFSGKATYSTESNIDLSEGTIEFWMLLKEPLDSDVFDSGKGGDDVIFRNEPYTYYNPEQGGDVTESFEFVIKKIGGSNEKYLSFIAYDGMSWEEGSSQPKSLEYGKGRITENKPTYIAIKYSQENKLSALYIDGFKIDQRIDYDFSLNLGESFEIGNPNIIIDEFRITKRALNDEEIKQNYIRGIPFSPSDIYYPNKVEEGKSVNLFINTGVENASDSKIIKKQRIIVNEPQGYVSTNTSQLTFSFFTNETTECRSGEEPDLFENLGNPTIGTEHEIIRQISSTKEAQNIYVKCDSENPDDFLIYKRIRVLPQIENKYPKLATFLWGESINEIEAENLSRFDVIGISKSNHANPRKLDEIRESNQDILITIYVDASGYQNYTSSYPHNDLIEEINDSMRLQNSNGDFAAHNIHPENIPCNLYVGNEFSEVLTTHLKDDIISTGYWDGIWYDVVGTSFWFLRDYSLPDIPYTLYPDIDMDGTDENLDNPVDLQEAKEYWKEGVNKLIQLTRSKTGNDLIIIGNGVEYYSEKYNGKVWEGQLEHWQGGADQGPVETFLRYSDSTHLLRSFPYWEENTKDPSFNWNLFTNELSEGQSHYRRHRLGLTASLIGGVYHDVEFDTSYSRDIEWYDEYWIDLETAEPTEEILKGKGYLGYPISEIMELENNVWRKDFEYGIVLLNGEWVESTVNLDYIYRYIKGSEDPGINKGGLTGDSITINGKDGIILLRALCFDNPRNDPRCIPLGGEDGGSLKTKTAGGGSSGGGGSTFCGNGICEGMESCSDCPEDCGKCIAELNRVYLYDEVESLETFGGRYEIVIEGIKYLISIYDINKENLKILYDGKIYTINISQSQLIQLDGTPVKISFAGYENNLAKLNINKGAILEPTKHQKEEISYFIIYLLVILISLIIFISKHRKKR